MTTALTTRMTTALTTRGTGTTGQEEITYIAVIFAARRCGLTPRDIRRYVRRGLVSEVLTEADLAELRRIRRLINLGVNLAGVEIILHMRRRIEELLKEADHLQSPLDIIVGGAGML
jgi:MerR family transcriptional regulator/heat shock protein HspR